jgi:hypothetical protein
MLKNDKETHKSSVISFTSGNIAVFLPTVISNANIFKIAETA